MNEVKELIHKKRIKELQEYKRKLREIKRKQFEQKKLEKKKLKERQLEIEKLEIEKKKVIDDIRDNLIKEKKEKKESIKNVFKKVKIDENEVILSKTQKKILNLLSIDDFMRRDVVAILGIARTTIYDNLVILERYKMVSKYTRNRSIRSRPLTFWKITNKGKELMRNE
jgi:hypothetical protein